MQQPQLEADDVQVAATQIPKKSFQLKSKENGKILKIHHTIKTADGQAKRIKFNQICYGDSSDIIAAVDVRGNIYIFDLRSLKLWVLPTALPNCSAVKFVPTSKWEVMAGTKSGEIILLNIANGTTIRKIHAFKTKIKTIDFPDVRSSENIFVATTAINAIIFKYDDFQQQQMLEYPQENFVNIRQIAFVPNSEQFYGCFNNNNSIHVWTNCRSLELEKHIYPIKVRERFLKKSANAMETIDLKRNDDEADVDIILRNLTKDYSNGLISGICFSLDGKLMCICTMDDYLMVFSTSTWEILKIIKTKNATIMQCVFVSQPPDKKNVLAILTSLNDAIVIDLDDLRVKMLVHEGVAKIVLSKNCCMLGLILTMGEVLIFNVSAIGTKMDQQRSNLNILQDDNRHKNEQQFDWINNKIQKTLPKPRLMSILKEYTEYPAKYRQLIWKTLLQLPQNINSFSELLRKGNHPCVADFDQLFPLRDVSALRNLKRLTSCLAHWSKPFGKCDYLPRFVFPFLKIFETNILMCFETIATILLNHCQLWFEFAPLEPYNYLGMIENILAHFEPNLIRFYETKTITTKTYAWPLLQTGFSEVLDEPQWLQLWDNIISNQPDFLIFSVVAYNVMLKSLILRMDKPSDFENFFEETNTIDMKKLIAKTYELMDKCPETLRPTAYMKPFHPLHNDHYDKFVNFPKTLICSRENEIDILQNENKILNHKLYEMEKLELQLSNHVADSLRAEEHSRRLKEVEKCYEDAIVEEENRLAVQRKHLLLYQRELCAREKQALEEARQTNLRTDLRQKENELESLLRGFERTKIHEENDLMLAEEDLRFKEMNALLEKYNKTCSPNPTENSLTSRYRLATAKLENEKLKLNSQLKRIDSRRQSTAAVDDLTTKIGAMEQILQQIQIEFKNINKCKNGKYVDDEKSSKLKDLELQTNKLELEVEKLLNLC